MNSQVSDPSLGENLDHRERMYRVTCLPPAPFDWSLKDLYDDAGVVRNPALAGSLGLLLGLRGVHAAFAPSVATMSGEIVCQRRLDQAVELPLGKVPLYRAKDIPSDGTWINRRHAFVMSGSGTPIIVAHGGGRMVVAHASRDSLIDRARFSDMGREPRTHESVLEPIQRMFRAKKIPVSQVRITVFLALPEEGVRHHFDHPEYGKANRDMARYVRERWALHSRAHYFDLDIAALVRAQALALGFERIASELPLPIDGAFGHVQHPNEALRGARNLIVVQRLA